MKKEPNESLTSKSDIVFIR